VQLRRPAIRIPRTQQHRFHAMSRGVNGGCVIVGLSAIDRMRLATTAVVVTQ
jgi:hypothetical protein